MPVLLEALVAALAERQLHNYAVALPVPDSFDQSTFGLFDRMGDVARPVQKLDSPPLRR